MFKLETDIDNPVSPVGRGDVNNIGYDSNVLDAQSILFNMQLGGNMPVMVRTVRPSDVPLEFVEAYDFFACAVKFWANQLGMSEYSIVVDTKDDPDVVATFHMHPLGRTIDIYLTCNSRVIRESVNFNRVALFRTALHELLEAVLIDHDSIMQNEGMTDAAKLDATEALRHKIIHMVTPIMESSSLAHAFLHHALDDAVNPA